MLNKKIALAALIPVVITGCAIHQTVRPVGVVDSREICVIEAPAVKEGFLDSYMGALRNKGFTVRKLAPTASLIECRITSTYTANWRWDLATYMAYAEIKIYDNGKPVGEAKYDALRGGGNMEKFIKADKKIAELVDQLFPGGAGSPK